MLKKNIIYIVNIVIIVIGLSVWLYGQCRGRELFKKEYLKSNFKGTVGYIIKVEGNHDMPTYIFTNDSSHLSGENEAYLHRIVKVGDSLIKKIGIDTIEVYRKSLEGDYNKIYP